MSEKPENPFVYPQEETKTVGDVEQKQVVHPGMTLRDYFAGQALDSALRAKGLRGQTPEEALAQASRTSYIIADAMLAEREQ